MEKIIFILIFFLIIVFIQENLERVAPGDIKILTEEDSVYVLKFNDNSKALVYISKYGKTQDNLKDEIQDFIKSHEDVIEKHFSGLAKNINGKDEVRVKPIRMSAGYGVFDYSNMVIDTVKDNISEAIEYPISIPKAVFGVYLSLQYVFIKILYAYNSRVRNVYVITDSFDKNKKANKMMIMNHNKSVIISPKVKDYEIIKIDLKK